MTIFDKIYAVFSSQFREEFYNFQNDAMFQRICDCVGVVHVQEGNSDKLLGSWESVRKAHDVLTAYIFLRSLNTPMNCFGEVARSRTESFADLPNGTNLNLTSSKVLETRAQMHVGTIPVVVNMDSDTVQRDYIQTEDSDETDLDPHYKAEIGKLKPEYDVDGCVMYNCDMCSYVGHKQHNLVVHKIRTHIRPYKCGRCSRGFGLRKDLRRHHNNKRSCTRYGKDYKQQLCREWRTRLDMHLLNIEETNKQEVTSNEGFTQSEDTRIDDNCSSTSQQKDTDQTNPSYDQIIKSEMDTEKSMELKETPSLGKAGASIENVYSRTSDLSTSEVDQKQFYSNPTTELEIKPISYKQMEDPSTNMVDAEKIFMKNKPAAFTATQLYEKQYNSGIIKSEHETESTSYIPLSNPDNREKVQIKCHTCNFISSKKQQVEDHIKRVHCKQYECTFCGSMFGMTKDLNRHYRRTHGVHLRYQDREREKL
ncbi:zinc finger protein 271-like [Ostrea edulis]|uniref:zinc finger protein 271-like n=1 Tax=Ostrea edulis TaxID=37623 RepID=UPI002094D79C|nr:zinc finger protein 271-like [Ostrea edulis]